MNMKVAATAALIAGVTFTVGAVAAVNVVTPYARAEENTQTAGIPSYIDRTDLTGLATALQRARSEIQDPDMREFYDELVVRYGVAGSSDMAAQQESPSPGMALPDVKKIQQIALMLPFEEAAKNIQDKDIAEFYRRFLNDNDLAGPIPAATVQ